MGSSPSSQHISVPTQFIDISLKTDEDLKFLWNSISSDNTQEASLNSFLIFSGFGERFSSTRRLSNVLPETTQTAECNVSSIGSEAINDHVDGGDVSMTELAPEGVLASITKAFDDIADIDASTHSVNVVDADASIATEDDWNGMDFSLDSSLVTL